MEQSVFDTMLADCPGPPGRRLETQPVSDWAKEAWAAAVAAGRLRRHQAPVPPDPGTGRRRPGPPGQAISTNPIY